MCGIAGYSGEGDTLILKKMADTLRHRGPDDEGYYSDGRVGLAHRRLSIIDLSPAGHQPMTVEKGDIQVVFNGEIYNFGDLRKGLESRHKFTGHSDTEVIAHLYEETGEKVFSKIDGMFAIAIYDKTRSKLFLARDRMGKKPLYYGIFDGTLIFGSELKALMVHPKFEKELDIVSLNKYLQYEYIPTPHTMFKNVWKLEPGHYASYDGTVLTKTKFWEISFVGKEIEAPSLKDSLERLDTLLYNAVKKRMVSDVPLGIFLSGGIDSSTIAYYAQRIARENGAKPVKTFSIGFSEGSFDESAYARQVSKYLGTEHEEKILSAKDSLSLIPDIADFLDEPLADASIIPTYLLSRFTREHVTVALGGDGGDELLCGYDTFLAHRLADIYEKIPEFMRKDIFEKLIPLLPVSQRNMSFDFKAKKFIAGFYGDKKYRNQRWLGAFDKSERAELFSSEVWRGLEGANEFDDIDRYLAECPSDDYYNQLMFMYLRTYMMDDILVKVDRASMYNSLEVRAPFLDTEVVNFLVKQPLSFKLRGLTTKYLLKQLMEDKLPSEIVYRNKKGFGIPLTEWLKGELKPLVKETLSEESIKNQGLFNMEYIDKLKKEHFSGQKDNRKQLWALMVFSLWHKKWME
ncbi:MAG: asparagine synthase (glutamine-hydrolyzing) [Candidatus Paceibacterota bacterium]|jgi:asparagine synthase (glutamine-hydrolysing)